MGFILPEILGSLRGDLGPWRALKVAQDEQFSELVQSIQRCSLDQHLSYKSKGVSGAALTPESSLLWQNFPDNREINRKLHANQVSSSL